MNTRSQTDSTNLQVSRKRHRVVVEDMSWSPAFFGPGARVYGYYRFKITAVIAAWLYVRFRSCHAARVETRKREVVKYDYFEIWRTCDVCDDFTGQGCIASYRSLVAARFMRWYLGWRHGTWILEIVPRKNLPPAKVEAR